MDPVLRQALVARGAAECDQLEEAARRVAQLEHLHWEGAAGEGFRRQAAELARELRAAAALVERAMRIVASAS